MRVSKLSLIILLIYAQSISLVKAINNGNSTYLETTFISGEKPELKLYVHEYINKFDLSKTRNFKAKLDTSDLYKSNQNISSFQIDVYEINGQKRDFISRQNLSFQIDDKNRVISLDPGYFTNNEKNIELELYDSNKKLINIYQTKISAINLDSQIDEKSIAVSDADCPNDSFGECHLKYIFDKISFEAKPQKQISTRIIKDNSGFYKLTVPVTRKAFGELNDVIRWKIDDDDDDSTDNGSNFDVSDPYYFTVKAGDGINPGIKFNSGLLSNQPINGALEYDGKSLYFTSNGTRSILGARGERGSSGSPGPQGIVGPQGPQGPIGTFINGGLMNGTLAFGSNGLMQNSLLNGTTTINGPVRVFGNINGSTARFTSLFINGSLQYKDTNQANGSILTSGPNGQARWRAATALSVSNASTLDNLDSSQFIRSDLSDSYTGTELDFAANTLLDLNGNLEIADPNIIFDGVSTTFTQNSGAFNVNPAAGSNLNINLSGTGDFAVNTNQLYIDTSASRIGIGTSNPGNKLTINGSPGALLGLIPGNGSIANSAFIQVNNRARFGYNGSNTSVVIDDGSANKAIRFSSGNAERLSILTSGSIGIGNTNPHSLLTLNGTNISFSLREGSAPTTTVNYGKVFVNSANSRLYFQDDSGVNYNLTNGSSAGTTAAAGSNTQFQFNNGGNLGANGALTFVAGTRTLAVAANATLDIDSTNVSIADSNIDFDSGSGVTFTPTAGQNLNIALATTGDFAVNTNQLYVDTSATNVGIGTNNPNNFKLQVLGNIGPNSNSAHTLGSTGTRFSNTFSDTFTGTTGAITTINATTVNATTVDINYTDGSIIYSNSSGALSQNNAHLYFNPTTRNMGIGTNTPSSKLEVRGAITTNGIIMPDGATAGYVLTTNPSGLAYWANVSVVNNGSDTSQGSLIGAIQFRGALAGSFQADEVALFWDDAQNRLGLGTNTPGYNLDVRGDAFIESNGTIGQYLYHVADTDTSLRYQDDDIEMRAGNELMIDLHEDGAQDIVTIGDGGDIDINFNNDMFTEGSSSNVGIGTTSPSQRLDVVGSVEISNDLHLGQYLYRFTDNDTFMRLQDDDIQFSAGGETLLILNETASQDTVTIGDGGDVNINLNNALFINGQTSTTTLNTLNGTTANFTTINASTLNISNLAHLNPQLNPPGIATMGDLYVDSDTGELCFYDGVSWTGIKAGGACN
ncbi:MAG: hypothetical protein LW817_03810 [Candidatus Caenarcaniphilales bacterium]|nr:hypothetical protein [Candidatus Caenarcaniphilales bacterium]